MTTGLPAADIGLVQPRAPAEAPSAVGRETACDQFPRAVKPVRLTAAPMGFHRDCSQPAVSGSVAAARCNYLRAVRLADSPCRATAEAAARSCRPAAPAAPALVRQVSAS